MTKSLVQFGIALSAILVTVVPHAVAEGNPEELELVRVGVSNLFDEFELRQPCQREDT